MGEGMVAWVFSILHTERPCLRCDLNPGPSIIQKVGVKGVNRDPEINVAARPHTGLIRPWKVMF